MSVNPTVCTLPLFKRSDESLVPVSLGLDGANALFSGILPTGVTVSSVAIPVVAGITTASATVIADPDTARALTGVSFTVSGGTNETTYRIEVNATCSDSSVRQAALDVVIRD